MTDHPIQTCSMTELRRGLSRHIAQVSESGQPLYITRRGKIVAVLLSLEHYELMLRQREDLRSQLRITQPDSPPETPDARSFLRDLKGTAVDEADYRRYLEEKYR
ncbi:MAG: type II toxin-antitoxin system Phd/YefM family antitoxin [Coriobacteriia bacterium]|nr:type II toxin-antitoxin system Phd/YefM family antitoxin [Coriobacteriia bacterium]